MKPYRYLLVGIFAVFASMGLARAEDEEPFNPGNPPEPMVQYAVSVSADPAQAASYITKGDSYSAGKVLYISVTPASGYRFLHWTLNGVQYSTFSSFSYTVGDSIVDFVAHLAKNPTITVSVSPANAGSAYGGGSYAPGNYIYISTAANPGYTFQYWTLNGVQYSTEASFSYLVEETDAEFVAVYQETPVEPEPEEPFTPEDPAEPMVYYPVTITTNLPAGIKPTYITNGGYFAQGKMLNISTMAAEEYAFLYWMMNGVQHTTSSSFSYTVGDSAVTFTAVFEAKKRVSLSVSPDGAATVSGGGLYAQNTKILISTTPKSGYAFRRWTLGGAEYATTASFEYYVGSTDVEFVAVYEQVEAPEQVDDPDEPFIPSNPKEPEAEQTALLITVLSNDTIMGMVSGLPTTPIFEGDTIVLTATPKPGYAFIRWSDNNTSNPRTIIPTHDAIYRAYFEGVNYTITFYDEDSVTILSQHEWNYGDMPTCISPAKPSDDLYNYRFVGWSPEVVNVVGDAEYYAVYEATPIPSEVIITVGVNDSTLGYVTGLPNTPHYEGETITLTALPKDSAQSYFLRWENDSTDNPREIVLTTDSQFVAYFALRTYTITFYDDDSVTVLDSRVWEYGQLPTCESPEKAADDEYSYEFIGWTPEVVPVVGDADYYAVYEATLIPKPLAITVGVNDSTLGYVTGLPDTLLYAGDTITLTALPKDSTQAYFLRWENDSTDNPREIVLTTDSQFVAYFALRTYTITFYDDDSVTVLDSRVWEYGALPTCENPEKAADDEYSYEFIGWTPEVVPVVGDAEYYAVYEATPIPKPLVITVGVNDSTLGYVTGMPDTTLYAGDTITLTAIPVDTVQSYFLRWENDSTDNPREIVLTTDSQYVAYFALRTYTVTFYDDDSVTVLDSRVWEYGQLPTCESPEKAADDEYSYEFVGWTPEVVTVVGDADYYAVYEATPIPKPLAITVGVNDSTLGYVTGLPDTLLYAGDTITLTAIPVDTVQSYFLRWENDSTDNPREIVLTTDSQYVAYFALRTYTVTFYDDDSVTVLDSRAWEYGSLPTCDRPTKPSDDQNAYEFVCWTPQVVNVVGDAKYYAMYDAVALPPDDPGEPEPTYLPYDAQASDFIEDFDCFMLREAAIEDGNGWLTASNDNNAKLNLLVVLPEGAKELSWGAYPVSGTGGFKTVVAGAGVGENGWVKGSYACYSSSSGSALRPLWYIVEGVMTVDQFNVINLEATNSYGRTIRCRIGRWELPVENVSDDQLPATKILRNGQLFIMRGEHVYNVQGVKVE